jgi:mannosyltransferase OCH1-like enzyme
MIEPKTIFQTFKTTKLPLLTQWHVYRLKKKNSDYEYVFFDDEMISDFILKEFGQEVFDVYSKINIGAVKADFFRYAVLYKRGGVYLDIDSLIVDQLDHFIRPDDSAVISLERNDQYYIQYALFFEAGHPFLKRTIEIAIDNLKANRYPHNGHQMTGPTVFTAAIKECLEGANPPACRVMGYDYDDKVKFSYRGSKTVLYGFSRKTHWKKQMKTSSVMK